MTVVLQYLFSISFPVKIPITFAEIKSVFPKSYLAARYGYVTKFIRSIRWEQRYSMWLPRNVFKGRAWALLLFIHSSSWLRCEHDRWSLCSHLGPAGEKLYIVVGASKNRRSLGPWLSPAHTRSGLLMSRLHLCDFEIKFYLTEATVGSFLHFLDKPNPNW